MIDTSRIQHLVDAITGATKACIGNQIPLTMEEKEYLIHESANLHNAIVNMTVQKICGTCEHCVFWENKYCCAARDMAPIPFEVSNRIGGCSKWYEKDFIPF